MASRYFIGVAYNVLENGQGEDDSDTIPITCTFLNTPGTNKQSTAASSSAIHPRAMSVVNKIKAGQKITHADRVILYNDVSVKLHLDKDTLDLKGIPIHIEHNTSTKSVGTILESWIGESSSKTQHPKLMVFGEVWDQNAKQSIDSGILRGLSVGYGFTTSCAPNTPGVFVENKTIKEISLCKEPFFRGCNIDVTASKNARAINKGVIE